MFGKCVAEGLMQRLRSERVALVGGAWFFFTTTTFADREGVKAKGLRRARLQPIFHTRWTLRQSWITQTPSLPLR